MDLPTDHVERVRDVGPLDQAQRAANGFIRGEPPSRVGTTPSERIAPQLKRERDVLGLLEPGDTTSRAPSLPGVAVRDDQRDRPRRAANEFGRERLCVLCGAEHEHAAPSLA